MKFISTLLCAAVATLSACSPATYQSAAQPICVGGSVRDASGACVLPTTDFDVLGLPTTTAVTNFAPAILPVLAVVGAAAAAGAVGTAGGGETNATNGTN